MAVNIRRKVLRATFAVISPKVELSSRIFITRNCAKASTYAELIADFLCMLEWLVDWIVRRRGVEGLELWIVVFVLLDRLQLQPTAAARADLLLLQELDESVLVLENASQKVLEGNGSLVLHLLVESLF